VAFFYRESGARPYSLTRIRHWRARSATGHRATALLRCLNSGIGQLLPHCLNSGIHALAVPSPWPD